RDVFHAELFGNFGGLAVKGERRTAAAEVGHFNIAPAESAAPAGAERFHAGLFRCEARGVALETIGFTFCIGDFAIGENASLETVAVAFEGFLHARDLAQIDARADDHRPAPLVVMVRRPCFTPLVEMSASASFCTCAAFPLRIRTSR